MGLFNILNSKENNNTNNQIVSNKVNLLKEREQKVGISLAKKTKEDIKIEAGFALDVSGSMRGLFTNGIVQNVVERLFPIAVKMDRNKELDMFLLSSNCCDVENSITIGNFEGFVDSEIIKSNKYNDVLWHCTNYAPVLQLILDKYKSSTLPVYIMFIVDGGNDDKKQTEEIMRELSKYPIFIQFVGIGNARFDFLEKLDNLTDRVVDNANFFKVSDINSMSDNELYDKLLNEFPTWLKEARTKGIVK